MFFFCWYKKGENAEHQILGGYRSYEYGSEMNGSDNQQRQNFYNNENLYYQQQPLGYQENQFNEGGSNNNNFSKTPPIIKKGASNIDVNESLSRKQMQMQYAEILKKQVRKKSF